MDEGSRSRRIQATRTLMRKKTSPHWKKAVIALNWFYVDWLFLRLCCPLTIILFRYRFEDIWHQRFMLEPLHSKQSSAYKIFFGFVELDSAFGNGVRIWCGMFATQPHGYVTAVTASKLKHLFCLILTTLKTKEIDRSRNSRSRMVIPWCR